MINISIHLKNHYHLMRYSHILDREAHCRWHPTLNVISPLEVSSTESLCTRAYYIMFVHSLNDLDMFSYLGSITFSQNVLLDQVVYGIWITTLLASFP